MSVSARLRPRKSLGQHWLTDGRYLRRIAEAADIGKHDTVIEAGAGTGLLTERLIPRAARLIAVEIDPALCERLRERFGEHPNVVVVQDDVLAATPEDMLRRGGGRLPYVVIGNLPYFIGTAIIRRFLESSVKPRWIIATLQAEVAENMAASPGRMRYLSVATQLFADARIIFQIPAKAFRPAPKVASAVVRLDVLDGLAVEVDDTTAFLKLVQAGFAAPRKRLRNSLAIGLRVQPAESEAIIGGARLDPARRPAELSLGDWRALYFAYRAAVSP